MDARFKAGSRDAEPQIMVPRRVGQFLDEKRIRWLRYLLVTLAAVLLAGVLAFVRLPWVAVELAGVVALALLFGRGRRFDPEPIVKGLRGEEALGRALEPLETEGYQVLGDLETGFGNVDLVVVGPTGVFAIEVKNWRGRFYLGPGGRLMHGGRDVEGVIDQALREAMLVRDRLGSVPDVRWVEAVVVSAGAPVRTPIVRRNVMVLGIDGLVGSIRSNRRRLSPRTVAAATAAILRGSEPVTVRSISVE